MKKIKLMIVTITIIFLSGFFPSHEAQAKDFLILDNLGCNVNKEMQLHLEESLNPIGFNLHVKHEKKVKREKIRKEKIRKERIKKERIKKEKDKLRKEKLEKERKKLEENVDVKSNENENSTYESYANKIYNEATTRGLDGALAVAISQLETGNWTSNGFINKNNFGGLMGSDGLMYFTDKEEGLNAFLNTLENYKGMDVETMGCIYCPVNTEHWIAMIKQLMVVYQ